MFANNKRKKKKMKQLMIAALAVASCTAFAEHKDLSAPMSGFYDVQISAKRLAHATKTVTKTFTTKRATSTKPEQTALAQLLAYYTAEDLGNRAGFEVINLNGLTYWPEEKVLEVATKITFKYSYYDFKLQYTGTGRNKQISGTNYITKIVTDSLKGVYDASSGKVYTWNTASANKITVKHSDTDEAIIAPSKTDSRGNEKDQKGFKAYEVPLAMHGQFVKTDDYKAAGGFTGGVATAKDDTQLDFSGMTAFGTGTFDAKKGAVKTVSGNIACKYPDDLKYGCYGTWKINLDANSAKYADLNAALVMKGCVELINEVVVK